MGLKAFSTSAGLGNKADNGLHVSVVLSRSGGFTTMRLFRFMPCACGPVASIRCFAGKRTSTITSFLSGYELRWVLVLDSLFF